MDVYLDVTDINLDYFVHAVANLECNGLACPSLRISVAVWAGAGRIDGCAISRSVDQAFQSYLLSFFLF